MSALTGLQEKLNDREPFTRERLAPNGDSVSREARMAEAGKKLQVYVTCAVTGSADMPTMSTYLPITPDQIASDAERVRLEDSLTIGPDELARSNADQVRQGRRIIEELSREIATPEQARRMLAPKGADQVAF